MFRIIVPVYNAQKHIAETIDSIINQTIGFEDNVCLHLIDDASKDDSLKICNEYREKYPDNIIVTHFKKNKGVSAARNYGVKKCKYLKDVVMGFLDSDDYMDSRALEKIRDYFSEHEDIHVAVSKIILTGRQEGEHKSNWRFEQREVVDIVEDYNFPQYYIGGVFLRNHAKRLLRFSGKLNFWEDALALNQVIIKEGRYGLIKDSIYYYRKDEDEGSLVDISWTRKERYNSFLKNGYMKLLTYCRRKRGEILPYVQFVVANHLRLYFFPSHREAVLETLNKQELDVFKQKLSKVLQKISEDVISNINTSAYIKEGMFSLKKGEKVRGECCVLEDDVLIKYKDYILGRISEQKVKILGRTHKEGYEGWVRGRFVPSLYAMKEEDYIFAECNGEKILAQRYTCNVRKYILDKMYRNYKYAGFVIQIPDSWREARWGINIAGTDVLLNRFSTEEIMWMK